MNGPDIVCLSKKLISIENKIDKTHTDSKIWYSLWFDMVGALYSFLKANPLLRDESREHREIIADAKGILELIKLKREIDDKDHDAWFDGYYLNNAEFRILKACYPCNMKHPGKRIYAPQLVEDIPMNKTCAGCSKTPIPLNRGSDKILRDFKSYDARDRRPDTTGEYLKAVHLRVNSLKHTPDPKEDLVQTRKRTEWAWKGLLGIYELFSYIAKQRGALMHYH
jgi:hypothetical protein